MIIYTICFQNLYIYGTLLKKSYIFRKQPKVEVNFGSKSQIEILQNKLSFKEI